MNLSNIKALILDMDGVLWRENAPIGDLPAIFNRIHERGLKVALATNNATRTIDEHLTKLSGFGLDLEAWQIVSSATATANILTKEFPNGGAVFVVGQNGIQRALEERGFKVMTPTRTMRPLRSR